MVHPGVLVHFVDVLELSLVVEVEPGGVEVQGVGVFLSFLFVVMVMVTAAATARLFWAA